MYAGLGQDSSTGVDPGYLSDLANRYNDAANGIRSAGGSHIVVTSIEDRGPYAGTELINVSYSNGTSGQTFLNDFEEQVGSLEQNVEMIAANTPDQQAALAQAGVVPLPPIVVTPVVVPLAESAQSPEAIPYLISVVAVPSGTDQISTDATPGLAEVLDAGDSESEDAMYAGLGQSSSTGVDSDYLSSLASRYNDAANSVRAAGGSHVVVTSIEDRGPYAGTELLNVSYSDGTSGQTFLNDFEDQVNSLDQNVEMIAANTPEQQAALAQAGVVPLQPIIVSPVVIPLPQPDLVSVASPASVASGADQISTGAIPGPTNVPDTYQPTTFADAQAEAQQGESPVFTWNGQTYLSATGSILGTAAPAGSGMNLGLLAVVAIGALLLFGGRK